MNSELSVNTEKKRFEMDIDGQIVLINYRLKDNVMSLVHTEVPPALEGKGFGKAMVEKTLHYIKEHQYKLLPLCSFVSAYLVRHPEWNSILADRNI